MDNYLAKLRTKPMIEFDEQKSLDICLQKSSLDSVWDEPILY
jgi:hypothetical protein